MPGEIAVIKFALAGSKSVKMKSIYCVEPDDLRKTKIEFLNKKDVGTLPDYNGQFFFSWMISRSTIMLEVAFDSRVLAVGDSTLSTFSRRSFPPR